jgi:phytoene dehydrogenase-like protein
MGVFKLDWALAKPVPWRNPDCAKTAVVHLGGTVEEISKAESEAHSGRAPARPFVLLTQPSLFDPGRAPDGSHARWAYCHVPHASSVDMTDAIESQIERFAPGFRGTILAKRSTSPTGLEAYNPNYVGGDIGAGAMDLLQILARPKASPVPYRTPIAGVYLCSASTPPGPGVHGMCGVEAARAAIKDAQTGRRT